MPSQIKAQAGVMFRLSSWGSSRGCPTNAGPSALPNHAPGLATASVGARFTKGCARYLMTLRT